MRKIAQGATEAIKILTLGSEGGGYAQPPKETHHKNLPNASEKEKACSFPWKAVCKEATLATQLTRSAFTHLEAISCISKVLGPLIWWRPARALGFNRSSPKAAKPLRGSTQSNHQPPSLSQPFFFCKLKGFLVPSLLLFSILSLHWPYPVIALSSAQKSQKLSLSWRFSALMLRANIKATVNVHIQQ